MTRGMTGVIDGELRNAVRKIRDADFFGTFLQDVVQAAQIKRRQVFTIGIAGAVLD